MTLTARDMMTEDVETVTESETVGEVLGKLSRAHFNGFPVVADRDGSLVGIVTQGDLVHLFQPSDRTLWIPIGLPPFVETVTYAVDASWDDLDLGLDLQKHVDRSVSDVMTEDVVTVGPDADVDEVLGILSDPDRDINRLPVVEDGVLLGIVTREDFLRGLRDERDATR